jgi:hypothetical protein
MEQIKLKTGVVKVENLLTYTKLVIPDYQRPYKWTLKNVSQLIEDILAHKDKTAYRLGTIVIHQDENNNLNIVDGQQRTVTLILIIKALIDFNQINNLKLREALIKLGNQMMRPEFSNDISFFNIRENYKEIKRRVASFDEKTISCLLYKCEFTQFILTDLSEAFQFFDSQNARGKDLEPHDLLKAYHLREFSKEDEMERNRIVDRWESTTTQDLSNLFGKYLFRIRNWSKGNSARYFTKNDIPLFKGINIDHIENYPYTELIRIAHFYVDNYNKNYKRFIDKNKLHFPFQLDQMIINGRRFFEMIDYYKTKLNEQSQWNDQLDDSIAKNILKTINEYDKRKRIGDQYVRMLFDCVLFYYIDKFGYKELSSVIKKIFIWSYSIRLNYHSVQLASVDNYVLYNQNMFQNIRNAITPQDVISISLPNISSNNATGIEDIENLFKTLGYYEQHKQ